MARPDEALRRTNRSFQEVCHDLRQPAAAILALVAAAEAHPGLPDEIRRRLEQIGSEARHISTIVGQAAGDDVTFRPLDAGDCAVKVVESVRASTPGTITVVAEAGTTVVADASVLRRALGNLLDNAIRAAGPTGTVLVTVATFGRWVQFDVSDWVRASVGAGGHRRPRPRDRRMAGRKSRGRSSLLESPSAEPLPVFEIRQLASNRAGFQGAVGEDPPV